MSSTPNHITLIRSGAIGDFVLTLPAVSALCRAYPHARLRLIGNPTILRLAPVRNLLDINSAHLAGLYNPEGPVPQRTRVLFSNVDLLLAYAVDPDRSLQSRTAKIVHGRAIVYDPRPTGTIHITEHLLAPLRRLCIHTADPIPRILLHPDELSLADNILQKHHGAAPFVAIHPGSGGRKKCWPLSSYLKLARRLRGRGIHAVAFCGPVELEMGDTLSPHLPCLFPPDLRTLAGLLKRADLFIGNDSGPGHVAAAVGTATLTLFGPTDARTWAPRHPLARVLKAPGGHLPSLSVESVLQAALEQLATVTSPPPDSHRP